MIFLNTDAIDCASEPSIGNGNTIDTSFRRSVCMVCVEYGRVISVESKNKIR